MLRFYGERIYLQEITEVPADDSAYYRWIRDPDVIKTVRFEYLMPTPLAEIKEYVADLIQSSTDCYFAIHDRETEDFIGTLRVGHINWKSSIADIGIMIGDKNSWGKGIAKDAVATACDYAFTHLSLRKLTGGTAATNVAMCRCFERVGFQREARLRGNLLMSGEYVDHILFGLFKSEFYQETFRQP